MIVMWVTRQVLNVELELWQCTSLTPKNSPLIFVLIETVTLSRFSRAYAWCNGLIGCFLTVSLDRPSPSSLCSFSLVWSPTSLWHGTYWNGQPTERRRVQQNQNLLMGKTMTISIVIACVLLTNYKLLLVNQFVYIIAEAMHAMTS